ncbi:MAG: type II toxin-antitoxin system RelE/ParE family toxin [Candidatus Omnitrophota bacterium]
MRVVWLENARAAREAAIEYIAQESLTAALSQLNEIEQQTSRLAEYPQLGRVGRKKGTRELVINRTPFIAIYRIKGGYIQVFRFLHGAQKWP